MGQSREGVRRHGGIAAGHRTEGILTHLVLPARAPPRSPARPAHRVMQSHCVELSPPGSMQSPKNHARGKFAPNTARLTACRAGDIVAGSQKKRLNFLFVANYIYFWHDWVVFPGMLLAALIWHFRQRKRSTLLLCAGLALLVHGQIGELLGPVSAYSSSSNRGDLGLCSYSPNDRYPSEDSIFHHNHLLFTVAGNT